MSLNKHWIVVFVVLTVVQALLLAKLLYNSPDAIRQALFTGSGNSKAKLVKPAKLEAVPGVKQKRVTLTEKAAKRIGLAMAEVTEQKAMRALVIHSSNRS